MDDIATTCAKARDLILRDGFQTGSGGWYGEGGWCIEGALGAAMGMSAIDNQMSDKINHSPAGEAIRHHLLVRGPLHNWNDQMGTRERVLRALAEVAAMHTPEPEARSEELTVKVTVKTLPPMPVDQPKQNWVKELLGV
jgi:hypothetical protein